MKYFSMFTGIGGFELGIQRAFMRSQRKGKPYETSTRDSERPLEQLPKLGLEGLSCVGYSEIDKYAIQTYERHFEHVNYGDATKIKAKELPDFDLLIGGFPCQAFSIAGKRAGFNDTRGTLFFEVARILAEKRPRHLVLENVKGLLSHDSGKTLQTIFRVLADLGYRVEWQVLNSKDFGVPQNRERIYIVGHLGGECTREVFPIDNTNKQTIRQVIPGTQGYRVYDPGGVSVTLASQAGGLGAKTGLYIAGVDRSENRYDLRETEQAGTLTSTMYKGIDASGRTGVIEDTRIRRLTPKECERLQGFPDDWTAGVSDTQRYKQCGNAVTVNTVQAVMERLFEHERIRYVA